MSGMIKTISENSEKRARFYQSHGTGVFSVTLHPEIWGETEKPGRMFDTQAFIGDDHPAYLTRVRSVVLCQAVFKNCVLQCS